MLLHIKSLLNRIFLCFHSVLLVDTFHFSTDYTVLGVSMRFKLDFRIFVFHYNHDRLLSRQSKLTIHREKLLFGGHLQFIISLCFLQVNSLSYNNRNNTSLSYFFPVEARTFFKGKMFFFFPIYKLFAINFTPDEGPYFIIGLLEVTDDGCDMRYIYSRIKDHVWLTFYLL